ncbi:tumor necrosis factor receptor superfamily member 17 isoform X2 [Phyllobates terribilis]|uniref:tumor necrosis factor receptor superfamily member 17 isoform X2 n=1 Tax=Phyllobates terribilis TaxID=111132 RepID=UPI003CCB54C9
MGKRCPTSQYYDGLLQYCQPCKLRCSNLPEVCIKFNPCSRTTNYPVTHKEVPPTSDGRTIIYETKGTTNYPVTHKEVPPTSAGPTIIYKTKGPDNPLVTSNSNYIIWLVLVLVVVVSVVLIVTIMLHRKRKLHAGSFGEVCGKITTKSSLKGADLEQASCEEIKKPVAENEDVVIPGGYNIYGNALSDYLFPLPAVEEGAAILVTTKTSACINPGPGVRGEAFIEI